MKKNIGIEYLRVFASMSVIVIHVAALAIRQTTGYRYEFALFLDTFSRVAVPLFFMISGYFMLDCHKEIAFVAMWQKAKTRIFYPFLFWSGVYILFSIGFLAYTFETWNVQFIQHELFTGMTMYHFWFLPVLGGYYLLTPWLNERLKKRSDRQLGWLIVTMMVIGFGAQIGVALTSWPVFRLVKLSGFLGYYVIGYVAKRRQSSLKKRIGIGMYVSLSIVTALCFSLSLQVLSVEQTIALVTDNFFPPIMFASVGIFVSFVHHEFPLTWYTRLVMRLSPYTFGMYIIHVAVLLVIASFGEIPLLKMIINPLFLIISVTLISWLLIYSLQQIPVFRRFL